jgi:hypothetical protein
LQYALGGVIVDGREQVKQRGLLALHDLRRRKGCYDSDNSLFNVQRNSGAGQFGGWLQELRLKDPQKHIFGKVKFIKILLE